MIGQPVLSNQSSSIARILLNSFLSASSVTRCLQLEHLRITSAQAGQRVVISFFRDAPILQHDDAIGHAHGRKSMGNEQSHLASRKLGEALKNLVLAAGIE